jgi:hypothetical protein
VSAAPRDKSAGAVSASDDDLTLLDWLKDRGLNLLAWLAIGAIVAAVVGAALLADRLLGDDESDDTCTAVEYRDDRCGVGPDEGDYIPRGPAG